MTGETRALWLQLRRYLIAEAEAHERQRRAGLQLAKTIERLCGAEASPGSAAVEAEALVYTTDN